LCEGAKRKLAPASHRLEHGSFRFDRLTNDRHVDLFNRRDSGPVVRAALHGQSALTDLGNHLVEVEGLSELITPTEAPERSGPHDDGVNLRNLCPTCGHVAAELYKGEIRSEVSQLQSAANRTGRDRPAKGNLIELTADE
jgi:hypothetical protein